MPANSLGITGPNTGGLWQEPLNSVIIKIISLAHVSSCPLSWFYQESPCCGHNILFWHLEITWQFPLSFIMKKAPKFTKKILKPGTKYKQRIKRPCFSKLILKSVSPESEGPPLWFQAGDYCKQLRLSSEAGSDPCKFVQSWDLGSWLLVWLI